MALRSEASGYFSADLMIRVGRVVQLWPFVIASRVLALCFLLFSPVEHDFVSHWSLWLPFALGLFFDVILLVALRRPPRRPVQSLAELKMRFGASMMLIATGTFFVTWSIFVATSKVEGRMLFDAFAAVRFGTILVAAAAVTMSRPGFFVLAAATATGGAVGIASIPFAFTALAFVILMLVMVRDDLRHSRALILANQSRISDQQRALNLVRDFETAGQGWFWETDRHGQLVYISPTIAEKLGVDARRLIGHPFTDIIRKGSGSNDRQERTLGFSLSSRTAFKELTVQAAIEGEERWWSISGIPISNEFGNFQGFRGSGTDLTEQKRSEAEINQLARYDTLTGLANRLHINDFLERALRNHRGRPEPCAMMLLDLDRFKAVNDTLGHPVGDQLLQQVARRITRIVGECGEVGRLGGDEFQVVLPNIVEADRLAALADNIILSLAKPFAIEGEQVRVGSSIGIAISDGAGVTSSALVRNADLALYAAKDAGRGVFRFYVDAMHNQASERKAIEDKLRDALGNNEFELLYQPIVDLKTERVTGFEALIRWHHPVDGMISPEKFIPIAEEANLIVPIGEWIVRTACHAIARLGPTYRIAVNVSPRQFVNEALPATIVSAVAAAGIRPEQLELEITEGIFLDESCENLEMFQRLKRTGARLALDDFGTGYSALGYLKKAPFDKIKIDQSFVRGAADPESMNGAIISSIVGLAAALKMETTAEGVETHDELDLVLGLGCSHVQGYIYGKPMRLGEAIDLLLRDNGRVVAEGFQCAREQRRRIFRTIFVENGGYRYEAIVRNISSGGAMLDGLWNVPDATVFTLEFGDGVSVQALARWSIENRMGVQFEQSVEIEALIGGSANVEAASAKHKQKLTSRAA